mmetsp:Transcript_5341/g.8341  ORF Transcript_5341/g.8341 Transcript_5341/m.8341 type:complete len:217 (-) Transcript_5341:754-1404(-)
MGWSALIITAVAHTTPTSGLAVAGGISSGCMPTRLVRCAALPPPAPWAVARPAPAETVSAVAPSASYHARSAATLSQSSEAVGSTTSKERATVPMDTPLKSLTRRLRTTMTGATMLASCSPCSVANEPHSVSDTVRRESSSRVTSRFWASVLSDFRRMLPSSPTCVTTASTSVGVRELIFCASWSILHSSYGRSILATSTSSVQTSMEHFPSRDIS